MVRKTLHYAGKSAGCFFFVGSANPEKGLDAGHTTQNSTFDEVALPRGLPDDRDSG